MAADCQVLRIEHLAIGARAQTAAHGEQASNNLSSVERRIHDLAHNLGAFAEVQILAQIADAACRRNPTAGCE